MNYLIIGLGSAGQRHLRVLHKFLGNNPIQKIEETIKTIEMVRQQYLDNGIGRWAMIEKSSGEFVGWTGLKFMKEPINNHINFYETG